MKNSRSLILTGLISMLLLILPPATITHAQGSDALGGDPVYVDDQGVMRWSGSGDEVALFGTNYMPAFSQTYRGLKAAGWDIKEAIEKDVYHFARLGLDAYRVHMYEIEITDSLGNLIENEHLDLYHYTLYKLSERGIKTIMTPTTYYNAAWPDGNTVRPPGFANYISKSRAPVVPEYREVVKNYLAQIINHINPYNGMSAIEDPGIIALEIDNEPLLGRNREIPYPLEEMTAYINELAGHLRENGWTKPIFFNISINIQAKDAVLDSDIDGVTMQWYPAGLTSTETNLSNIMPFVHHYRSDEVFDPDGNDERYHNMAKMVYEFDPADIMHSYAMPMMARSFREAGVQFAAQFAYTPLGIAHMNTDFMTHYVNLAYTPNKAIGMLIASEVFHRINRREKFTNFPADTVFGEFRLSHDLDLGEMNTREAFLYSNNTGTVPRNETELERIAGAGSSPVVSYKGTGAYFLDKLADGVWRLEVMPDAIPVRNPFERPDFEKYVTHIQWGEHSMVIRLGNLGGEFSIRGLNEGNAFAGGASNGAFRITPGAYLLTRKGVTSDRWNGDSPMGRIRLGEYHAVPANVDEPVIRHDALEIAEAGQPLTVSAIAAGIRPGERLIVMVRPLSGRGARIEMQEISPYRYQAVIPAEQVPLGILNYWIMLDRGNGESLTFPGGHPGNPFRWNYYYEDVWTTGVIRGGSRIELWNAVRDHSGTNTGFGSFSGGEYRDELVASTGDGKTARKVSSTSPTTHRHELGLGAYVGGRLRGISPGTLDSYREIVVRARTDFDNPAPLKVTLVDRHGNPFSAVVPVDGTSREHRIPLNSFQADRFMLLPRLYTSGMYVPSWGITGIPGPLQPRYIDEIQFIIDTSESPGYDGERYGFEVVSAWLE